MDREEKKRYLNQYIEIKRRIESLADEGNFWKCEMQTIPISRFEKSGVRGTAKKRDPVVEHLDICIEIGEMEKEAKKRLKEIMSVINSVDDANQRSVLVYRYVNGLYFYEIAKKMDYSIQDIYYLHANALDGLDL